MAKGYTGKILRVDLSDGSMWTEEHDDASIGAISAGGPSSHITY